jgi:hypothetical protein
MTMPTTIVKSYPPQNPDPEEGHGRGRFFSSAWKKNDLPKPIFPTGQSFARINR